MNYYGRNKDNLKSEEAPITERCSPPREYLETLNIQIYYNKSENWIQMSYFNGQEHVHTEASEFNEALLTYWYMKSDDKRIRVYKSVPFPLRKA